MDWNPKPFKLMYLHTMNHILRKASKTASFLKNSGVQPLTAIIAGTGLHGLADHVEDPIIIPYEDIPNFPVTTVDGHIGQIIFGRLNGIPVCLMSGRFHFYEGYAMHEVTFPVRVFKLLGIQNLIVTNAAGGLNENYKPGSLVAIRDHINLFPEHPLRGPNIPDLGPRFPDMSAAYDRRLLDILTSRAHILDIELMEGVYAGFQGPNLETPAEYKFLNIIGADLVGMSTVPEVIVANHCGLNVAGLSIVTNICYPPHVVKVVTEEDVMQIASSAGQHLGHLIEDVIPFL